MTRGTMSKIERRYIAADIEAREAEEGSAFTTRGYAATFNEPYSLGPFDEQVDPAAFDGAVQTDDVRALWNHDPSNVLGRSGAGTLRLSVDKRGLQSEIDFPESAAREREAIRRGDVTQMSFGFRALEDKWETVGDRELRTITKAQLFDVSPVAFPANPATDISIAQRSHDEWLAPQDEGKKQRAERDRRIRETQLSRE